MVTAATVKGLADRLAKAEQLFASGAVFPVAGLDGYSVVKNGDGTQMYLVRIAAGHEHCSCPDYAQRQRTAGLPCKHILAAQLALGDAPQSPAPAAMQRPDPAIGMALLTAKAA